MKSNTIITLLAGIVIGAAAVILYESQQEIKTILNSIEEGESRQNEETDE